MGNIISNTTGQILATAAMSKYMKLSKEHVLTIRDTIIPLSYNTKHGTIKRESYIRALQNANIRQYPDQEILNLLFTLWDLTGNIDNVNGKELIIGISILACPDAKSFDDVLSFAMQVLDYNNTGMISLKDSLLLLQSMNTTALYLGDTLFTREQIHKMIDNVFDMISLVSLESEDLTHQKFRAYIGKQPLIRSTISWNIGGGSGHSKAKEFSKTIAAVIDEYDMTHNGGHRVLGIRYNKNNFPGNTGIIELNSTRRVSSEFSNAFLMSSRQKPIMDYHSTFDDGTTLMEENATSNDSSTSDDDDDEEDDITMTLVDGSATSTFFGNEEDGTEVTPSLYTATYESQISKGMRPLARISITSTSN